MLRCWAALILLGQQASATPAPSPAPTGPTCGGGYTLVSWGTGESKCLQLTASGRTFDECATKVCPGKGGHLACIGSAKEFDAVFDAFTSDPCADGGCDGRRRLGAGLLVTTSGAQVRGEDRNSDTERRGGQKTRIQS